MSTRREFLKTSGFLIASASAIPLDAFAFQARRALSRSRFPPARFVDRHPRRQHRDLLRRQDRSRPGHRHGVPPDHERRARHRVREHQLRDGRTDNTVDQGGSGGSDALQTDGYPMRRVAAEARRVLLEMASRAFRCSGHGARRQRRRRRYQKRRYRRPKHHLWRADRRQEVQRHAYRQEHRHHHRHRAAEAGAADEERRQVAAALRHSTEGGWIAEVGRRHEGAGDGPRAQRAPAVCRRHARQHRRVVCERHSRLHQGGEQG